MPRGRILKLIYKNEVQEMYFMPTKFGELFDYFLTLFNKKSCEKYLFYGYYCTDPDKKIVLNEKDFKNNFSKLEILKNPAVFIEDFTQDANKESSADARNIEYIQKNLKFVKDDSNFVESLIKKKEILKKYDKRISDLEKELNELKNIQKNEELIKSSEEYKKANLELIQKINSLK